MKLFFQLFLCHATSIYASFDNPTDILTTPSHFFNNSSSSADISSSDIFDVIDTHSKTIRPFFVKGSEEFLLGGLFPLTNNNRDINRRGILKVEAMKCAIKTINEANHFLPNVTLRYNIQDDQNVQSIALYKALSFVENKITTVIGRWYMV
jgi:hypothetical protein